MDPSLLYAALAGSQVDLITAYSSDGRISAYDLITLEDDRGAIPALGALEGTIDVEHMRAMNAAVAEEFLAR